jgi:hypothetical protein
MTNEKAAAWVRGAVDSQLAHGRPLSEAVGAAAGGLALHAVRVGSSDNVSCLLAAFPAAGARAPPAP